jgi:hypothetical protein
MKLLSIRWRDVDVQRQVMTLHYIRPHKIRTLMLSP